MNTFRAVRYLHPVDALIIAFALLLSVFCILFGGVVHEWQSLVLVNTITSIVIIGLAYYSHRTGKTFLRLIHDWYPVPVIFFSFKEMYVIIQSFGSRDYDTLLIAIDRWLFKVDPTVWLMKFSSPVITEILQISYTSFYFLMLAVGFEIYRRNIEKDFSFVMVAFLYGFFLSYIGYLIVPAVGPRFTLHNFDTLSTELPGLYVTDFIRGFINAGESIPKNVTSPMMFAQRDAFPSGHTEMTLIVIFLAAKYKLKSRHILYIFGSLLIISTVYLRYHYVVDLLGGAVFMVFTIWTAPKLLALWENLSSENGHISKRVTSQS